MSVDGNGDDGSGEAEQSAAASAVAVVGGGPAGLMAADVISAAGHPVVVYDRMPTLGRKLLMAGRGGLNLTHSEPLERFLDRYREARPALEPAIRAFPPDRLVAFAHDLGEPTFVGSSGRVFPRSMKASPLLRAWLRRLAARGVTVSTGHRWTGIDSLGRIVLATLDGSRHVAAPAVVLALGGGSWPRLGSDAAWVDVVSGWGVAVAPITPANVGVTVAWSPHMQRHAGAPLKRIAVSLGGERARGEAVLTAYGLEGGAVYALAPAIRQALGRGEAVVEIDLRPDETLDGLAARLAGPRGRMSSATFLSRRLDLAAPARALLHEACGRELPTDPIALARSIKQVAVRVSGLAGLERAISSAGGIRLDEVDAGLMLRQRPGFFVAGEMLDWEAPTGGYLLQAAFATGAAAGQGVLGWLAGRSPPGAPHQDITDTGP